MKNQASNNESRVVPPARSGRSFRAGLAVGVIGLTALIAGSAGLAAAHTSVDGDGYSASGQSTEAETDAAVPFDGDSAIVDLGPDLQAFDACIDEQIANIDIDVDGGDGNELHDALSEADEACMHLLPEDVFVDFGLDGPIGAMPWDDADWDDADWDDSEWQEFDQCMEDQLVALDQADTPFPTSVQIIGSDDDNLVVFGDEVGSVTISGTAEAVHIDADSGVQVLTGDEIDEFIGEYDAEIDALLAEAESNCVDLLPDGEFFFDHSVIEKGPGDDHSHD